MYKIKKNIFYIIFIFFVMRCSYYYAAEGKDVTVEVATNLGFEQIAESCAKIVPYVNLFFKVCNIAQEIKPHIIPNEEELAHARKINKQYILFTTEDAFESCLITNKNSNQKSISGCPSACEEIAGKLIMLGKKNKVDQMIAIYNQYKK